MNKRVTDYPIHSVFTERWSPRAFSDEPITKTQLMTIFEAARWAPSSYNNQPWIFIYGKKGDAAWNTLCSFLNPFNKEWAEKAPVLIVIASNTRFTYNNEPSRTHAFDTGAAWMNLALQAQMIGLVTHAMEGFNYEQAHKECGFSKNHEVHAMVALGKPSSIDNLSPELQKKEVLSSRKPCSEFVFHGSFKKQ